MVEIRLCSILMEVLSLWGRGLKSGCSAWELHYHSMVFGGIKFHPKWLVGRCNFPLLSPIVSPWEKNKRNKREVERPAGAPGGVFSKGEPWTQSHLSLSFPVLYLCSHSCLSCDGFSGGRTIYKHCHYRSTLAVMFCFVGFSGSPSKPLSLIEQQPNFRM